MERHCIKYVHTIDSHTCLQGRLCIIEDFDCFLFEVGEYTSTKIARWGRCLEPLLTGFYISCLCSADVTGFAGAVSAGGSGVDGYPED